jgi:glycosyltransferase involved in cell wall biosynthesis
MVLVPQEVARVNDLSSNKRHRIGVAMITKNEGKQIERSLLSVSFADEIVVVDSSSTDGTVELAKKAGARVFEREFDSFASMKNFAISLLETEWVLSLDADEVVTKKLELGLRNIADEDDDPKIGAQGYRIARLNTFLGKPMRYGGWFPDYQLRFFKRGRGSFQPSRIHESVRVDGRVIALPADSYLEHHTYETLADYFRKFDRYTTLAADELELKGKRSTFIELALLPPINFAKTFFFKGGFRDGTRGFMASALGAFYVFTKYAKLWEKRRSK